MGALAELRGRVVAALELAPDEWAVHAAPVDAVTPPAYMLVWSDPWLYPAAACHHHARLAVVCIAARIDPDPGIATLEEMVEAALMHLQAARIPAPEVGAPGPFPIGGVPYLAARLTITTTVPTGG